MSLREKIADVLIERSEPHVQNPTDLADAILSTIAESVPSLEFVVSDTGDLICDTAFGRYQIQKSGLRFVCMYPRPAYPRISRHGREESAIEAANAHHRQTILKAAGIDV